MKKSIFKALAVLLALIFAFSACSVAFAEDLDTPVDEEIIERYAIISSYAAAINISGITATCSCNIRSLSSTTLKLGMTLQKKTSSGYTNVQNWTANKTGTALSLSKTKTINPLSTYRLKVTVTAGSESVTVYRYA